MKANINISKRIKLSGGFLHLASSKEIVEKMQEVGVTAISGETIIKMEKQNY